MVGDLVRKLRVERKENILTIGVEPQLIVDLKKQKNYIKMQDRMIPYYREVAFSDDLLSGKRKPVFETAVNYYYRQACSVAEGMKAAEQYRSKMNTSVREFK